MRRHFKTLCASLHSQRHVGRHRRAISLFIGTSSSSSLEGLCTEPECWAMCSGDQTSTLVWSRSARWSGRVNEPRKWAPRMRVLKLVYMQGLISKKVHVVCIVHLGLAQVNVP